MMMQTTLSNVCQSETLALHTLFHFHRTLKLFYYHAEHTAGDDNDKNELRRDEASNRRICLRVNCGLRGVTGNLIGVYYFASANRKEAKRHIAAVEEL